MAVRGIAIVTGEIYPSPTFTGTVTFPDGSTWTSSLLTIVAPAQATSLAIGGATIGSNGLAVTGTAQISGNVGLGTVAPDTPLTINTNTGATVAPSAGNILHLVGADAGTAWSTIDSYAGSGLIEFRRADGTRASKSAITTSDIISILRASGWDGSAYGGAGDVRYNATEAWDGTHHGSSVTIHAVTAGGTTLARAATFTPALTTIDGAFTVNGAAGLTLPGGTLLTTSAALTNGAAAQTATLLNAPTAGNPTKWIPINDNGTTRYVPAW